MNYNTTLLSFRVTNQSQATYQTPKTDGVSTEIYPDTAHNGVEEGIKIGIVTITSEGKDCLKIESESIYKIDNYKFSTPIKSADKVAVKILANLSKHSLKLHSDAYSLMQKATIFSGTFIPDKTEEQIFMDLIYLYETREIKPGQSN